MLGLLRRLPSLLASPIYAFVNFTLGCFAFGRVFSASICPLISAFSGASSVARVVGFLGLLFVGADGGLLGLSFAGLGSFLSLGVGEKIFGADSVPIVRRFGEDLVPLV